MLGSSRRLRAAYKVGHRGRKMQNVTKAEMPRISDRPSWTQMSRLVSGRVGSVPLLQPPFDSSSKIDASISRTACLLDMVRLV